MPWKKELYRLVGVKLHKITALQKCSNCVQLVVNAVKLHKTTTQLFGEIT